MEKGWLGIVLGALLVLTAVAGITGWSERWRVRGPMVWILGGLSRFFGGGVGNQGGLRAAALSAFKLTPAAFVATSTVVGVMIDLARTPIYLYHSWEELAKLCLLVAVAAAGVAAGTLAGERVLLALSRKRFRQAVSVAVGLLGIWFLFKPR